MRKRRIVGATVAAALAVMFTAGSISAAGDEPQRHPSSPLELLFGRAAIVGTWDVTLTLPGNQTGRVLATFGDEGTTVESAATPTMLRGASHGVWERRGRNLFSVTRVFFRFDDKTGMYIGTTKVNATVQVAPDGETLEAVSVSELRNPQGQVIVAGIRGTAVGTRMHVEPTPDQP